MGSRRPPPFSLPLAKNPYKTLYRDAQHTFAFFNVGFIHRFVDCFHIYSSRLFGDSRSCHRLPYAVCRTFYFYVIYIDEQHPGVSNTLDCLERVSISEY